ncbi:hypothetical protein SFRURICE_018380 [Spodoptera frugiperda]|nr:hypothetical protein SFRURICE_018380 [Spodoptera frugiperda]
MSIDFDVLSNTIRYYAYANFLPTPQPSRETLRTSGIAQRSLATVSAGLRTASKGSSPPDQNQTRACARRVPRAPLRATRPPQTGPSKADT